ncbi:MAG: alpha/beta hydrolase [Actinomycetia bacterium]|nr:alpha/beta hydrolase [Actinomycetes bacterium]
MTFISAVSRGVLGVLGRLPESVQRRIAGSLEEIDGQTVYPEVGAALRLLNAIPGPTFEELPLERGRAQIDEEAAIFGRRTRVGVVTDFLIPAEHGEIPARRYSPPDGASPSAVLVYAHGGGFVLGGLDSADSVCRFLCAHAGIEVLAVDYRLAPEHPFPAATEDLLTAYRFAVEHAPDWGIGADRVMIGGDSAGGNLALVTALQVRDRRRDGIEDLPQPRLQVAFFPWVDFVGEHASHELFATGYFLTTAQLEWYADHYVPDEEQRANPYVSPLLAEDLTDLGPAYVGVAGFDPLRDEGIAMAERLREADNEVTLDVDARHIHAYVNATGVGTTSTAALHRAVAVIKEFAE